MFFTSHKSAEDLQHFVFLLQQSFLRSQSVYAPAPFCARPRTLCLKDITHTHTQYSTPALGTQIMPPLLRIKAMSTTPMHNQHKLQTLDYALSLHHCRIFHVRIAMHLIIKKFTNLVTIMIILFTKGWIACWGLQRGRR